MLEDTISVITVDDLCFREDSKENNNRRDTRSIANNINHWNILHIFSILAVCIVFASPWTLIPRTNSIFYQSHWLEVNFVVAVNYILVTGNDALNMAFYFKEKKLLSFWMLSRMYFLYFTTWIVPYLLSYLIWCNYLGYNWPIPYLGLNFLISQLVFLVAMWILFPVDLMYRKEFQRDVKLYMIYCLLAVLILCLNESLVFLFENLGENLQWIVAFLIPLAKHFSKWALSKQMKNMSGGHEESSNVLLGIGVNANYSFLIAIRLPGAETITVIFIIAVDFFLQLQMTYKIIQFNRKVADRGLENDTVEKHDKVKRLVLAELTEGITPIAYAVGFAMAYYGPNGSILGNIRNSYWGYSQVEDVSHLFTMMSLLFGVDTLCIFLNSLILLKFTDVKLYQNFCEILKKYWPFMAIKFALNLCGYFAANDINFGMDSTGKIE